MDTEKKAIPRFHSTISTSVGIKGDERKKIFNTFIRKKQFSA